MQIITVTAPHAISTALALLFKGELVIYPTETCYGIAADVTNEEAISKLLTYKGDRQRQVSIAVSSQDMAKDYVVLNSLAKNLYQEFLPGPITVISRSLHRTDLRLESEAGTLGVRYPANDLALKLITSFGKPLTATSANTSGKKEPYSLADYRKYTNPSKQTQVSLFLDAGKLQERPTSTVVDTTLNEPLVLRQGELTLPTLHQSSTSSSPEETISFAANLTHKYLPLIRHSPLILALVGKLGSGKTHFAKGVARALGITTNITSPTYTLLKEYPYTLPKHKGTLYHLDTWRLADLTELDSTLNLSKLLVPGNILVMEWAGKASEWLKKQEKDYPVLLLNLKDLDSSTRSISYAFTTPKWS